MGLQVFDDGSSLTTDATGTIVAATDSSGAAVAVPDTTSPSSITAQFANLVTYGVTGLINKALGQAPTPTTGVTPANSGTVSASVSSALQNPTVKLLLLAAAGLFLYKKFA